MDQLSPEIVAEFPERGMQWVRDRVETVVNETGEYVREKPTQSLLYAFAAGYVLIVCRWVECLPDFCVCSLRH